MANHLKIGARLLRALEEGDVSSLPHLAYTKGFIRSYSSYLGLAAEEVSEAVKSLDEPDAQAVSQTVYMPEAALAPRKSFKWLGMLIIAALLGIGAYVAWQQGAFEFLSRQTRRMAQPSPPLQAPDSADLPQNGARAELSVSARLRPRRAEARPLHRPKLPLPLPRPPCLRSPCLPHPPKFRRAGSRQTRCKCGFPPRIAKQTAQCLMQVVQRRARRRRLFRSQSGVGKRSAC